MNFQINHYSNSKKKLIKKELDKVKYPVIADLAILGVKAISFTSIDFINV